MANSRSSGPSYEYASVDTAPGASGYATNTVSPRGKHTDRLIFSIRESSGGSFAATVTLQFMPEGDTAWTDYATYTDFERKIVEDPVACKWRAIIKNGNYSSGTVKFGFEWSGR